MTAENPRPLIIHTHGGPNVYMRKDTPHVEIAYFLSQGFIVACPNYRGSTGYPNLDNNHSEWFKWIEKAKGKHHIYGPEDVYAVTRHLLDIPGVDSNKVYLRGGSFGSFINAHLLAGVKNGKFESVFKGAHFSGGVNYPAPSELPDDIPLLITHSKKDQIAPFSDARIFMEKALLKRLAYELDKHDAPPPASIETYIAENGDHHLIDPDLSLEDKSSQSFDELVHYLQVTTEFIMTLSHGLPYQRTETYDQYKRVIDSKDDPSNQILMQAHAFKDFVVKPVSTLSTRAETRQVPCSSSSTEQPMTAHYGPTKALLKLHLKREFTGDIKKDLTTFFRQYFKPVDWTTERTKLIDAGSKILERGEFLEQLVLMIEQEEAFLQEHPNHMVMYHVAEHSGLQLYTFINVWQAILKGKQITPMPDLSEMRLYEFMKDSFDNIKTLLLQMRKLDTPNNLFNNIPGFPERALACNPTLISNSHSTACSPVWWYFKAGESGRSPIEPIISEFFKLLGIFSPERSQRYLNLFEQEQQKSDGQPQALMQQLFVPYDIAQQSAYMCQIWGNEFSKEHVKMPLESPEIIRELIRDPELLEKELREHEHAFTNLGSCEGFGDLTKGFIYASIPQIRYLTRTNEDIHTNSYYRSPDLQAQFVQSLMKLVLEDYADYLACGPKLPDSIINGAKAGRKSAIQESNLHRFMPEAKPNHEAFFRQQLELYKGLVENPRKDIYGAIVRLNAAAKKEIQLRLRETTGKESNATTHVYGLCRYLAGYTYYDLLKEAAEAVFANQPPPPWDYLPANFKDNLTFVMEMIEAFSTPESINTVPISSGDYERLYSLLHHQLTKHKYNPELHYFLPPIKSTDPEYEERYIWSHEFNLALQCVLRYAYQAKEKSYGYDISAGVEHLFQIG